MSDVAKSPVFGISAILALPGDPISTLSAVPQALKAHFSVNLPDISKVILATNVIEPQVYLQSLSQALNTAGNYTAELSACVGTGIASFQALQDLISARTMGLLVVLDDPEAAKGLICAVITANPLISCVKGLTYTLNSPQTEEMTALETDLEALETFGLLWQGWMWKYVDKLVLVTRETEASGLFLAVLHRDMVKNPMEYGEIGKIARALDLENSHHRLMLDNYAYSAWKDRVFLEKPGAGNYGLVVQLGKWALAGALGPVLCLVEGESRQAAVCQWAVLPTEGQRKRIRLKPAIGRL